MQLRACPGLSRYDTSTLLYFAMILSICLLVDLLVCGLFDTAVDAWIFFAVFMFHGLALYFVGVLSGVIIARSTVRENLESLGFVKTDAVSALYNSITVI